MRHRSRGSFLTLAGLAAGTALFDVNRSGPFGPFAQEPAPPSFPDEILNAIEVSGAAAEPTIGKLPGERPDVRDEHHARRTSSDRFAGDVPRCPTGRNRRRARDDGVRGPLRRGDAARHAHRSSHAAILVLGGEVEIEVNGRVWRMMRGDFANLPPGTPHAWTMRSDRGQMALFTMNDRVGAAFVADGCSALIVGRPGR